MKPVELVDSFLRTMEARDLEKAKSFLAPGFTMTFPGDAVMSSLEELVSWSKSRYSWVRKSYDQFDVVDQGDRQIVYCFGRLEGEGLDKISFSGIRFIDRFTIENGKFTDQKVWNDMAEVRG
ncbi:MAG: nuclear transport factor 2 family protein [Rhodospirillales bacterium]